MAETKPAQSLHGHDLSNRGGNQWKHLSLPAVKQQWFLAGEQEMIERKPGGRSDIWHKDGEAIHARTDLIDPGFHDKPSKEWPCDWLIGRERLLETTSCSAP